MEQTPTETQVETQVPSPPVETATIMPVGGGNLRRIFIPILLILILVLVGLAVSKFLPSLRLTSVTLTYFGLWEQEQVMAPIIADFEKTHPGIKISYTRQSPKQYRERLTSSLARGEGPDIFRFHNTWLPMFKQELAAVPSKLETELGLTQNFYSVFSQDLKKGNQFFGVPLEIDGLGLFVNDDLFKAAGLDFPITWEALRTTALQLTVKDETGKIRTAGAALGETTNVEHWSDILALMMLQNGVDLANPTGNLAEDALAYFRLFGQPPNNTWDEAQDNSILAFAKGQVAMIFAPSWQTFEIKNINPGLNFKILPMPQLPGNNVTWASYWAEGVWQKSKHQGEAFEFLKYLASKEVMAKLYTEEAKVRLFGEPYSRIDLGQTLVADPYVGAFIKQAPNARSFYLASRTFDNGINDKIIKYFEDALNSLDKGVSPQAALETAAKGVNQVLATYGLVSSSSAPR